MFGLMDLLFLRSAKILDLANEFINHMISHNSNSYKNTIEVGYLTANVKAATQADQR